MDVLSERRLFLRDALVTFLSAEMENLPKATEGGEGSACCSQFENAVYHGNSGAGEGSSNCSSRSVRCLLM